MGTEQGPSQPNVLRNAIHMDVLRQHERLIALPPVDSVLCVSPVSFRYVRQDDPKFETLHKGVLSGSTVVGATGLCEESTSKHISSWPPFMVNHAAAKATANRLKSLQESCFIATPEERATAIKANDRSMQRYNRHKLKPFQAALRRYAASSRTKSGPNVDSVAAPPLACEATPQETASAAAACCSTPPVHTPNASDEPASTTVAERARTPEEPRARAHSAGAVACPSPAVSASGSAPELAAGSPLSPSWSDEDLQELRRRGLDPELLGQQLQVSLASVTGPGHRRTLVCSLSEPPSKAPTPAPPSPQVSEWLKGVPAVSLSNSKLARTGSAARRGKAKKKPKSGGAARRHTRDGSLSGAHVPEVPVGGSGGRQSLAQRLDPALRPAAEPCAAVPPVAGSSCEAPALPLAPSAAIRAAHGARVTGDSDASITNTVSMGSAGGLGLAVVEPLEAVPHEEVVRRGMLPWRMPQTMARACGRADDVELRLTWGNEQEAAALLEVLHVFPGSTLHEVGLCMLDNASIPPDWEVPIANLPPIGSSPDGLIYHPTLPQPPAAAGGPPAAVADGGLDGDIAHVAAAAVQRQREAMLGNRRWRPEVYEAIALPGLWEVVEVKNHCPFKETSGKGRGRWVCCDTGPRTAVPDQYVPQLQLEMLCTGLQSALLVSRSATRGTHVFRMWRSDRYCALLLHLAAAFYHKYGRPGCPQPPRNYFASCPVYHEFCRLTADLKARTKLLCHLHPEDAPFDQSQPLFL